MTSWAYTSQYINVSDSKELDSTLNHLGSEGWELINSTPSPDSPWISLFVFRRAVAASAKAA